MIALLDELGIERAHFYGVSLGSHIAMRLAAEQPKRVLSIALDSPYIAPNIVPTVKTEPDDEPPPWVVAELRAMHGDDWRTVVRNCDRYLQTPELLTYLDIGAAVERITAPTLIVRGDIEEPAHPLTAAIELHARIPHSWLWIAPANTSLITRQNPAETLRVLRDFAVEAGNASAGSEELANGEYVELLAQLDLFAGLRRPALARLASLARVVRTRAGATIVHQGEPADGAYVVARGVFSVSVTGKDDQRPIAVRRLGPGEFFGEMALLTQGPRSATVDCEAEGGTAPNRRAPLPRPRAARRLGRHRGRHRAQPLRPDSGSSADFAPSGDAGRAVKRSPTHSRVAAGSDSSGSAQQTPGRAAS